MSMQKVFGFLMILVLFLGGGVFAASAPSITSITPGTGAELSGEDSVQIDATDEDGDLEYVIIDIDGSGTVGSREIHPIIIFASGANPTQDITVPSGPYSGDTITQSEMDDMYDAIGASADYSGDANTGEFTFNVDTASLSYGLVDSDKLFPNGTYNLTFTVVDSLGNESTGTRNYSIENGDSPSIQGEGSTRVERAPDGNLELIVDANDNDGDLRELEVDHSMQGTLPEFSVYAVEGDGAYGSSADKDQFDANGATVEYSADSMEWTINLGATATGLIESNGGISFYLVVKDEQGNASGHMGIAPLIYGDQSSTYKRIDYVYEDDAYLIDLMVDGETVSGFDPAETEYSGIEIPYDSSPENPPVLSGVAANSNATISIFGPNFGEGIYGQVIVCPESENICEGGAKIYNLYFTLQKLSGEASSIDRGSDDQDQGSSDETDEGSDDDDQSDQDDQDSTEGSESGGDTDDEDSLDDGDESDTDDGDDSDDSTVSTPGSSIDDDNDERTDIEKAYQWAFDNGLTTMETMATARLNDPITRAELAKVISVYAIEVLNQQPQTSVVPDYNDVDNSQGDLEGYITLAYQLGLMGRASDGSPLDSFNPNDLVTRAQFATVLSRMLYGEQYETGQVPYYASHIDALAANGILENTDPNLIEFRGWIFMMLMGGVN